MLRNRYSSYSVGSSDVADKGNSKTSHGSEQEQNDKVGAGVAYEASAMEGLYGNIDTVKKPATRSCVLPPLSTPDIVRRLRSNEDMMTLEQPGESIYDVTTPEQGIEEDAYEITADMNLAMYPQPPTYKEASQLNVSSFLKGIPRAMSKSKVSDEVPLTSERGIASVRHSDASAMQDTTDSTSITSSGFQASPGTASGTNRSVAVSNFDTKEVHVAPLAKFYLFFSNLVATLLGLGLIVIGSYSAITQGTFADLSGFDTDPTALIIVFGCFVTFLASCGMIGSLREHRILIRIFHITLLILLLAELTGGLLVYFLQNKVKDAAADQVINAIKKYETTSLPTALDDAITQIQVRFQCCGARRSLDWRDNSAYYECSSREIFENLASACSVPPSCCRREALTNTQCGYKVFSYPNMTVPEREKYPRIADRENVIWNAGCVTAIYDWLRSHWKTLVILSSVILALELLGIEAARKMLESLFIIKKRGHL